MCSVLLSDKLFGKVNAQLLVPIFFSTEIFVVVIREAILEVVGNIFLDGGILLDKVAMTRE